MRPVRLAALLTVGCALWACPASTSSAKGGPDMQLRPHAELTFTRGHALSPPAALRAWLDQQGKKLVRAPVTVDTDPLGSVRGARLGELAVTLDDSALGISLADRLRHACPDAATCRVWLEGLWDASNPAEPTLRLRRFVREVQGSEPADAVEVEVAPGR
jgi:hypothetical protein